MRVTGKCPVCDGTEQRLVGDLVETQEFQEHVSDPAAAAAMAMVYGGITYEQFREVCEAHPEPERFMEALPPRRSAKTVCEKCTAEIEWWSWEWEEGAEHAVVVGPVRWEIRPLATRPR
jgi:hypothetical protein